MERLRETKGETTPNLNSETANCKLHAMRRFSTGILRAVAEIDTNISGRNCCYRFIVPCNLSQVDEEGLESFQNL